MTDNVYTKYKFTCATLIARSPMCRSCAACELFKATYYLPCAILHNIFEYSSLAAPDHVTSFSSLSMQAGSLLEVTWHYTSPTRVPNTIGLQTKVPDDVIKWRSTMLLGPLLPRFGRHVIPRRVIAPTTTPNGKRTTHTDPMLVKLALGWILFNVQPSVCACLVSLLETGWVGGWVLHGWYTRIPKVFIRKRHNTSSKQSPSFSLLLTVVMNK